MRMPSMYGDSAADGIPPGSHEPFSPSWTMTITHSASFPSSSNNGRIVF